MKHNKESLPESVESALAIAYRSTGLGLYGAIMRFAGMPLEKIALYMNSAQVSGKNQLRQAMYLTFQNEKTGARSFLKPYKVVGAASGVAWFLQYSVMGMVFQVCDTALSSALGVPVVPYGEALMEDPSKGEQSESTSAVHSAKVASKILLAPVLAGTIESVVANRAEVQRYFGISKFAKMESSLRWNPLSRLFGPAFVANSTRNCIMSATSFVITPILYRNHFPQELKSQSSMFWFGLSVNVFLGNTIAITQQALWGRALDYAIAPGATAARNIHYSTVAKESLAKEGFAAFYTVPKWGSRVLMNAPVQGTLPWFYNEVLPLWEGDFLSAANLVYGKMISHDSQEIRAADNSMNLYSVESKATATSPRQE